MPTTQINMQSCIDACDECRDICERTFFTHCLQEGGKHTEPDHAVLMADCIAICDAASGFMSRGSAHHAAICAACAEICTACAESCAGIESPQMRDCSDACRTCAEQCRQMSDQDGGQARRAANM